MDLRFLQTTWVPPLCRFGFSTGFGMSPGGEFCPPVVCWFDSHGYNGRYSILPTKSYRYNAPHTLSLFLAPWLLAAPTLPESDLCHVELDINDRIWRTRCDCDVNIYILFFLTFSIKLLSWRWRLIAYLFSTLRLFEIISRTNLDCTIHSV